MTSYCDEVRSDTVIPFQAKERQASSGAVSERTTRSATEKESK
jgi:hypothetical protein